MARGSRPGTGSATMDSNSAGFVQDFMSGRANDWKIFKGVKDTYKMNKGNVGKTADQFFKDFGGGHAGKGLAKTGGYIAGGAVLWDMLF